MTTAFMLDILTLLLWWGIVATAYAALIFSADAFLEARSARRRQEWQLRDELRRIDADTDRSVERIAVAFVAAQQMIRQESAANRGRRS